jgi:TetR/AcrR family transcriptional regulator, transcriptional repressor for nem operon
MGRTSDASERLIRAALDLMWEESYGGITIDDICKRADVKKGSFYYFYESKADLALAAIESLWQNEWKPNLDTFFSSSVDPLKRITSYLERVYPKQVALKAKCGRVLGCPVFSLGNEVSPHEDVLGKKLREIFSRKRRYFESAIRDAIADGSIPPCDAAQKALSLSGLIEGIMSQARVMNDAEILKNLPQMALELLQAKQTVVVPAS